MRVVPSPRSSTSTSSSSTSSSSSSSVALRGALLEQGVERGLHVVGVEFLVEVEAFLVVVLVGDGCGLDGRDVAVDLGVIEVFVDPVLVEVCFEIEIVFEVLIEVLGLFYFLVYVVVEIVVAHGSTRRGSVVVIVAVIVGRGCPRALAEQVPGAEGAGV